MHLPMHVSRRQTSEFTVAKAFHRIRGRTAWWLLLFVSISAATPLSAQPATALTLVKAGRLLDPRTGTIVAPAAVLIEQDKIKQVGPAAQIGVPAGAKSVDLGSATLLPGLIDAHTHL